MMRSFKLKKLYKNKLNSLKSFSTAFKGPFLGAIDQSTTSSKFAVFTKQGDLVTKTQHEHKQYTPQRGWIEHNPLEILENINQSIKDTIQKLKQQNIQSNDIRTVGITNQRETIVAWNKNNGKPYYNAIVWNDIRTQEICQRFVTKFKDQNYFKKINGLPINTYFSAFKIRWLIENVPEIKNQLQDNVIFGTMDTWVVWNLTNKLFLTDVTNASRTFLMNLEFGIPEKCLPKICSSSELYGEIQHDSLKNIPINAILGDQQSASMGHGLYKVGSSKNTYGTGCFFQINIGKKPNFAEGLLTTVLFQLGKNAIPYYAFEGSIEIGASTINWARNNLKLFSDFKELDQLVNSVKDNGGIFFVPAFSGLFSPFWRTDITSIIIGMSFSTERGHILRALLEAIAYRTKDVVNAVEQNTGIQLENLKVDGGVTTNNFLMQFQADILQKPVLISKIEDSTSLGCVFAAGLSHGIYKDLDEISQLIELKKSYQPSPDFPHKKLYTQWQKAINKTFDWNN